MPYNTETNTMRLQLARNAVAVYSVESALYMTAGLMDIYADTDVSMETAILKVRAIDFAPITTNQHHFLCIF